MKVLSARLALAAATLVCLGQRDADAQTKDIVAAAPTLAASPATATAATSHAAAAPTLTAAQTSATAPGTPAPSRPSGPVPRLPDGHPDLNGTWDNGSGIDFVQPQKSDDGSVCIAGCPQPAAGTAATTSAAAATPTAATTTTSPPSPAARQAAATTNRPHYKPEFLPKVQELDKRQVETDPVLRCKNPGLPRIGPPDKIIQQSNQIVFLYDDVSGAFWRIIPMDGRPHRNDVDPSYLGDSIGHWEGDTLVVEANQFNDDSWLTDNGAFHTTDLHVTERLRRVGDSIEYQAVASDPKVLAEPWKPKMRILKLTHTELVEPTPCVDQDLKHLVDDSHHTNPR